jgi:hypothetical protein
MYKRNKFVTLCFGKLLNVIWFAENQTWFSKKLISWKSSILLIIANVSLFCSVTTLKRPSPISLEILLF